MSHTPGPWSVYSLGETEWDLLGPYTKEDWQLAAAAPDLLNALLMAREVLLEKFGDENVDGSAAHGALLSANIAIHKAFGG